ncbi:YlqD family protein [Geitlerinema sp. PCC 9228]|jgi:hypothetical protein|uniref:YlqD family protein n=1 Tax=Geitlerinema sp. PCC 9228 TaxID=111611 RepID=UPI0008F9998B|nr:YlqD family protein [Geitlerinema sp. PCC 9228]
MNPSNSNPQLLLKRNVTIKAIVTPRWKEDAQTQLQSQMNQLDKQLQQLEMQGQRAMSEVQQQAPQGQSGESPQPSQDVKNQVNQKQRELLEQKNRILQQLQQVQKFEMEQEVNQGQVESFFQLEKGDNLIQKMQVEIVLRDGVVEEIRGQI